MFPQPLPLPKPQGDKPQRAIISLVSRNQAMPLIINGALPFGGGDSTGALVYPRRSSLSILHSP